MEIDKDNLPTSEEVDKAFKNTAVIQGQSLLFAEHHEHGPTLVLTNWELGISMAVPVSMEQLMAFMKAKGIEGSLAQDFSN